jgi:hypothetical protein
MHDDCAVGIGRRHYGLPTDLSGSPSFAAATGGRRGRGVMPVRPCRRVARIELPGVRCFRVQNTHQITARAIIASSLFPAGRMFRRVVFGTKIDGEGGGLNSTLLDQLKTNGVQEPKRQQHRQPKWGNADPTTRMSRLPSFGPRVAKVPDSSRTSRPRVTQHLLSLLVLVLVLVLRSALGRINRVASVAGTTGRISIDPFVAVGVGTIARTNECLSVRILDENLRTAVLSLADRMSLSTGRARSGKGPAAQRIGSGQEKEERNGSVRESVVGGRP